FRAGHIATLAGLSILGGSQLFSLISFRNLDYVWEIPLLLTSVYIYLFSSLSRNHWTHKFMVTITSLWTTIVTFFWFDIEVGFDTCIAITCLAVTIFNICTTLLGKEKDKVMEACVCLMSLSLLAFNVVNYFFVGIHYPTDWFQTILLTSASMAVITQPGIWRDGNKDFNSVMAIGTWGLSTALLCMLFSIQVFSIIAIPVVCMVIATTATLPIAKTENDWLRTALRSAVFAPVIFWIVLTSNGLIALPFFGLNYIAVSFATAFAMGLVSFTIGGRTELFTATVAMALGVCQSFVYFDLLNGFAIIGSITSFGIVLISIRKILKKMGHTTQWSTVVTNCGLTLIAVGGVGAAMFVVDSIASQSQSYHHLLLVGFELATIVFAGKLSKNQAWKRGFTIIGFGNVIADICILSSLSTLTMLQRIEIGSVVLGTIMLAVGHVGWYRETGKKNDLVSFNLIVGSMVITTPLMVGLIAERFSMVDSEMASRFIHEIGGLTVGLGLLASGILCRIRSTTSMGATTLLIFVFSNVFLIDFPDQLQTTSIMMMIGGGLFFSTALGLSIYRDRIVKLPAQIKNRKGVFQIINWR
ncbi:MAG: hypothetical protein AAGA30_04920, partial [Planctomycetota bacterium]